LFKLAYSLQERRLLLRGVEDSFLKLHAGFVKSDSIVNVLKSLREVESRLQGASFPLVLQPPSRSLLRQDSCYSSA
jgi:hypothetical protein